MHEIVSVEEMNEDSEVESAVDKNQSDKGLSISLQRRISSSSFAATFQIKQDERDSRKSQKGHVQKIVQLKTAHDGFNFGRVYYFKPDIDISSKVLVHQLKEAAKLAKARIDRKSRFQKSQESVRRLQQSTAFQTLMASLIMLVNRRPL